MKDMHSFARISSEIFAEPSTSVDHSEQPLVEEVLEKDDNESAPKRSKRQRTENPLVMILLCTLWTILPRPLQRHLHLLMLMTGKKLSIMRWTRFFLMELGSCQNDPMDASLWAANGCSRRS